MSVRLRMHLLWMMNFAFVVLLQALVLTGVFTPKTPAGLNGAALAFIGIGVLMLPGVLYWDYQWLARPRASRFPSEGRTIALNPIELFYFRPNDPPQVRYFLLYFLIVCAYGTSAGISGLMLLILGGEVLLAHELFVLSYVLLLYILWRLHTCWARIYLK